MESLLNIYEKIFEIVKSEKVEKNEIEKIFLYSEKRKTGELFIPSYCSSILIILPGAGFNEKSKRNILNRFNFLLRKGIGLCIFELTEGNLNKKDAEFFEFFKDKVGEIRGIIRFIEKTFKEKEIFLLGISFGGIIGFIVSAIEEKIKKCIFLISGGNIEVITWQSMLRFYLKKDCSRRTCRRMHKIYRKLLNKELYEEIKNLPRKCFIYDPLTYVEKLKNKKILMVNGLFDTIIPFFCVLELKRKIKNMKVLWYPGTHFTFMYFFIFIKKKIIKFLKNENLSRN